MTHTGKVVIVTGAATGIGQAAGIMLAERGWCVVASYHNQPLTWAADYEFVLPCYADVSTAEGNRDLVEAAEKAFGRVDGLVLNAAKFTSLPIDADDGLAILDLMIRVNLVGPVLGIRAALPALRRAGGGSIVVVSSMNGLRGDNGYWAYAASKFGVLGVVQSLSRELGWENIRVNATCPGPTGSTSLTIPLEEEMPETFEVLRQSIPLQRWSRPAEQAGAIAFLLSEDASFLNGAMIPVDGGVSTGFGMHPPATGKVQLDAAAYDPSGDRAPAVPRRG